MRILFLNLLTEAESLGGAEKSLLLLLKNLNPERFSPILATNLCGRLSREAEQMGCKIKIFQVAPAALTVYRDTFSFNPFLLNSKYLKLKKSVKDLQVIVEKEDINVIYTNNIRSHILGIFLARKTNKILVWHFRDILFNKMRFLFRLLGRQTYPNKIIAVSQAVAANFPFNPKVTVIYNGMEVDSVSPSSPKDIRRELQLSPETPLIALIGRLTALKRPQDFIQAAALVKKVHPQARFLLIGDMAFERNKNLENELLSLRAELKMEKEVIFTGYQTDILSWLTRVNILTLLSEHEAFPRVILEALAVGVPVIATRVGGIPEIIEDNKNGFLIEVGDIETLANKINQLLENKALAREMGENGYKLVKEKFQLKDNVEKIEKELEKLF